MLHVVVVVVVAVVLSGEFEERTGTNGPLEVSVEFHLGYFGKVLGRARW
jgi:hypothetical protein